MINKNNLKSSLSPYLLQHKDNPVNWQEWSKGTLLFAKEKKTNIIGVGWQAVIGAILWLTKVLRTKKPLK